MLEQELEMLKSTAEVVFLYLCGDEEPLTGIIHTANNRVTAMILFNDNGEYEGWTVFETENVTQLVWGNREHRALSQLIDTSLQRVLPLKGKMSFTQNMVELGSRLECIALYIQGENGDSYEIVKVTGFDVRWLKIHTFGSKETLSKGWKLIPRDDVIRIEVDTPYMNRMLLLHREEAS